MFNFADSRVESRKQKENIIMAKTKKSKSKLIIQYPQFDDPDCRDNFNIFDKGEESNSSKEHQFVFDIFSKTGPMAFESQFFYTERPMLQITVEGTKAKQFRQILIYYLQNQEMDIRIDPPVDDRDLEEVAALCESDIEKMCVDEELEYMKKHPPRCIRGHTSKVSQDIEEFSQKNYGKNITVFAIKCKCGSPSGKLLVPDEFGPISFKCHECANNMVVFDPAQHGYDGELGHNNEIKKSDSHKYKCVCCGENTFVNACGFQYSGETDVLEDEELDIQPEDLYGWFFLMAKCKKCGNIECAYEWECA